MSVKIMQSADKLKEVPQEILASAIVEMSKAVKALKEGPLTERALIVLIQNQNPSAGLTRETIKAVLQSIEDLEKTYVKPKKKVVG